MDTTSSSRLAELPLGERVGVVREEIGRVTDRLGDVEAGLLDGPAVGDWTIREVIAHLVVVAEFYTNSITRGASGDAGVAGDRPRAGTGRGEIAAGGIRRRAVEVAETFQGAVIEELRRAAFGLADALDADESNLQFECYHPGGVLAANRFVVLFLKELGLHEWDMFEALEPPCAMSRWGVDAALQAMEEELASGSLRWVTDADASADPLTLRVTLSGHVAVERDLVIEPPHTRLFAVDPDRAVDSSLSLDSSDFVLGCSGRRDLVALVADGRAQGDPDAVRVLAGRLTGM
ncbi:MAG: maleylpyruvate isomerase N-terminal domain-containing protein [Actinomycetota bacterium]|jgi:hypothetical protein|nr:maleylpyruvate isomerase N-terminal domain-containing protein [Actinomycetota bacterium]